jgi:hypothetical protein
MKVLVLSNGNFIEKEIKNNLESLQNEVGGYIEIPFLSEKLDANGIDMIINEEGKMIDDLVVEIAVVHQKKVVDLVFGNIVFASHDDEGNTIGLTEEQIEFVKQELKRHMIINRHKNCMELVRVLCI